MNGIFEQPTHPIALTCFASKRGKVGAAGSLQSPGSSDPYQTGFFSYGNIASNHIGSFTYDFVFNFNSSDLATVGGTTPLYKLEFWRVNGHEDSTTKDSTMIADTIITKNLYDSLSLANTQASGRDVTAEQLGKWKGQGDSLLYRYLRVTIPPTAIYQNGSVIDVRLRTFAQIAIRPRLMRIRNWVAQQVLSGAADAALITAINRLKLIPINDSLKAWHTMVEDGPNVFHSFAYVHNLSCDTGGRPLEALINGDVGQMARVVRDQCEPKNAGKANLSVTRKVSLLGL